MSSLMSLVLKDVSDDIYINAAHGLNHNLYKLARERGEELERLQIYTDCDECIELIRENLSTTLEIRNISWSKHSLDKIEKYIYNSTKITKVSGLINHNIYDIAKSNKIARERYLAAIAYISNIKRQYRDIMPIIIQKLNSTQYDPCWRT